MEPEAGDGTPYREAAVVGESSCRRCLVAVGSFRLHPPLMVCRPGSIVRGEAQGADVAQSSELGELAVGTVGAQ